MADRLLILTWHNVDASWSYPCPRGAGAPGLVRQLRQLARVATVVPLESALDALVAGRPLPPRAVALTFDDGYQDNIDLAVPMLEWLGLPATFFLVPGILSGEVKPWWEVLGWAFTRSRHATVDWGGRRLPTRGQAGRRSLRWAEERLKTLDRNGRDRMVAELRDRLEPVGTTDVGDLFLDWDCARQLVRRGFTVGSHSMHHAILSRETDDEQAQDLAASRRALETALDVPVHLLAYPNGSRVDYDAGTVRAAERAGYAHALTVRPGLNDRSTPTHELRRVVLEPAPRVATIAVRRVASKLARAVR
jgi:peptidoglycan/xylan/chitin deacetylase (PgdA/CDA1 family)